MNELTAPDQDVAFGRPVDMGAQNAGELLQLREPCTVGSLVMVVPPQGLLTTGKHVLALSVITGVEAQLPQGV